MDQPDDFSSPAGNLFMPIAEEGTRRERARNQSLMQAQLAAAIREALKDTLAEPLPFEVRFLLDLLAAKEQAARRASGRERNN